MWPFREQVRAFEAIKPAERVLAKGVNSETLSEAYNLLCASLEERLRVGYLLPIKQQQNLRDINDITMEMANLTMHYEEAMEVFSRENVHKIVGLIKRASEYAQDTDYELNIADRKRSFLRGVVMGRKCYEAWKPIKDLMQSNVA